MKGDVRNSAIAWRERSDASPDAPSTSGTGRATRLLNLFDTCLGSAAAVSLGVLVAVVFANVVARYVFNASMTWASEVAQWLFVLIIFLGIPLAHRSRLHVSVTVLVDRMPSTARTSCRLFADAIVAYTTIKLGFAAIELIDRVGGVNYALNLPGWAKFLIIPLSCGLAILYIALRGRSQAGERWQGAVAIAVAISAYLLFDVAQVVAIPEGNRVVVMVAIFLGTMVLGTPVAFAMLFAVLCANAGTTRFPDPAVAQTMVNGATKYLLLAVPLFLTAGAFMNAGGLTQRLMNFAYQLVGHLRGGFAQVNVTTSLLYGGISGSSYSDAAVTSKLLVPQMVARGYPPAFACAVTASSAILPNIIPPSIALLLLAAAGNLSVGDLWLAGIGPGLLLAALLMLTVHLLARRKGLDAAGDRASSNELGRAFLSALPSLALALVILGGVRFGIVTPTEAGVLAIVYALILGMAAYRGLGVSEFWAQLKASAIEAALIGLLIGVAAPFAFVLVSERTPQDLVDFVSGLTASPAVLLITMNACLLMAGMALDIGAAILVLTPLVLPVMIAVGLDPIHAALIVTVNLMLGGLTPPVGMLAFVTSTITQTPVHAIFRALLPFLAMLIVGLGGITFLPWVSTALVHLLR